MTLWASGRVMADSRRVPETGGQVLPWGGSGRVNLTGRSVTVGPPTAALGGGRRLSHAARPRGRSRLLLNGSQTHQNPLTRLHPSTS